MKSFLSKTKGNYLHNDKGPQIRKYLIPIIIAFVVLYGGREILAKVASFVTLPLYSVRHYFEESSATIPVFFRSRMELDNEIKALKQKISENHSTDATLLYLTRENEELRLMLNSSSSPRIGAAVISRPPYTPYDTMIINSGSAEGIVLHAPVYFGSTQAIGYVSNVFLHDAQVTLFSSPNVESIVYIFGPNIFTTAYGEGGGIIRLSVPQGITIEKDNVVILPSLPSGVLGTIDDIQSLPTEPEQHAYITFDASLQSIRLVSVGTSPLIKTTFDEAEFRVREEEKKLFMFDVPPNYVLSTSGTSSLLTGTSSTESEGNRAP